MSDAMNNPYANNPNQNGSARSKKGGAPNSSRKASRNTGHTHQTSNRNPSSRAAIPTIRAIRIKASLRPHATSTVPTPTRIPTRTASSTRATPPVSRTANHTGQRTSQSDADNGTNNWQPISPFKLMEEWLPKKAKNAIRGTYAVLGIAAVILGLALLIWPGATLKVAAIALGAYFVVSGVVRIVTAIVELGLPGGWRVLDILIGLMLSVGGVVMLKNAALSGATLAVLITMVVGLGWMLEGVMALVESWRMPSSAWAVIYALLSIVAGFIVLFSPVSSTTWLILFGGCALVAIGIVAIVRAFTFGKSKRK